MRKQDRLFHSRGAPLPRRQCAVRWAIMRPSSSGYLCFYDYILITKQYGFCSQCRPNRSSRRFGETLFKVDLEAGIERLTVV